MRLGFGRRDRSKYNCEEWDTWEGEWDEVRLVAQGGVFCVCCTPLGQVSIVSVERKKVSPYLILDTSTQSQSSGSLLKLQMLCIHCFESLLSFLFLASRPLAWVFWDAMQRYYRLSIKTNPRPMQC